MERTQPARTEGAFSWWRTRTGIAVIGFALVGAFYVLREHWGHALGTLPYLLILACPLMHLFMHRGHHQHGGGSGAAPGTATSGLRLWSSWSILAARRWPWQGATWHCSCRPIVSLPHAVWRWRADKPLGVWP